MELEGTNRMSGGPESLVERGLDKEPPTKASAGEAVLLGALAQGVNVSASPIPSFKETDIIMGFRILGFRVLTSRAEF